MLTGSVLSLLMVTATQDMSARLKADAQDARQNLAVFFVKVGQTFRKIGEDTKEGGLAAGHAAKEGGIAVGHAARTVGQEAGQGVKRVGKKVKKHAKKFGQDVQEAFTPDPQ